MTIRSIVESTEPRLGLQNLLTLLHEQGPESSELLEQLSYYKLFHSELFAEFEEKIISTLGLFYKVLEPTNFYSFILGGIGKQHHEEYGEYLTPVQASVRRAVNDHQIVSISAPTSAGKSYSIRDFIAEGKGDAVIVVPSRALIAEYMNTMRQKFAGNKSVMISAFVDTVFHSRELRRIFILTPERARDLFTTNEALNIDVFFFDEAQVSEEHERGVLFDVLVRRVKKKYEKAKIIFAHPFVDNPEAQLTKHNFSLEEGYSRSYTHGTVGKICIYQHSNKKFYYFTPFQEKGHLVRNCVQFESKFSDFAFNGKNTVLIYVSKSSIYNGKYLEPYKRYIDNFSSIESIEALELISTIEHLLGADANEHKSEMVSLLKKGVVIHHGSVPLEVRFLVEELIRKGFAKLCFATSTLAQGVNMPFDIVWLDNMRVLGESEQSRALSFKNLIGRAGRLSSEKKFDFGYVFTKNPQLLASRVNEKFRLREESLLDTTGEELDPDLLELIQAIKNNTFDDEKHAPLTKIERLGNDDSLKYCKAILDILYGKATFQDSLKGQGNRHNRDVLKTYFQYLFEASLGRVLVEGEAAVFSQAISIFLQIIQGRTFREIVGLRFARISNKEGRRTGNAKFSQPAEKLPKSSLVNTFSLFDQGTKAKDVSYDAIVFDTYDYVDQVISFSLTDTFMTAFKVYKEHSGDMRADKIVELLRYGTNDVVHTLLMRYGFAPEDVADLSPYIHLINEENIIFKPTISEAPSYIQEMVDWYLP
ncbi:DEAD/DEAH box helicase [Vibrio brasiliensis]|uniref:DEAD/DEAH box helicase n=1 Tax=Vibrio brasiliensis TaxID=170652 RepID=UPI001EFD489C|nr:DEAD/DEAH box helicase [Vibrio brasiliensis]MCG9650847.1 DEAD/DEAH box helicase [Vibrio brasiliensis]